MKRCPKCTSYKDNADFSKDKSTLDGLSCYCRKCDSIIWSLRDKIKYSATRKRWNEKNKEKIRQWEIDNKERRDFLGKIWRDKNKDRRKEQYLAWKQKNPDRLRALKRKSNRLRKASLKQPIAKTFSMLTTQIYLGCPEGFHVDHIVPLLGKTVTGLHVPWNLQYLRPKENIIKGNKLCPQ